ncbi:hypothetical protein P3342_002501 [Pyrenophora teres f. teres]|nr:hypothetical protein P3342_002501 [Pyrenophora teres f. teres]
MQDVYCSYKAAVRVAWGHCEQRSWVQRSDVAAAQLLTTRRDSRDGRQDRGDKLYNAPSGALVGTSLARQVLRNRAESTSDAPIQQVHSRFSTSINESEERETVLDAVHLLGDLYHDQGKLGEAEQMYDRALRGKEALGGARDQQYLPALNTLGNMGELYAKQDGIAKVYAMYVRALSGLTSVLG